MSHAKEAELFNKDEAKVNWHEQALWFVRNKRDKAAQTVKGWEELRNLASAIKTHVLSNLDEYLIEFEENAQKNGIHILESLDLKRRIN